MTCTGQYNAAEVMEPFRGKIFIHDLGTPSMTWWTSLAILIENGTICGPELSQPSCAGQMRQMRDV